MLTVRSPPVEWLHIELITDAIGEVFSRDGVSIYNADVLTLYEAWPTSTVIVSDGAYGLGAFEGDPHTADTLGEWYEPYEVSHWREFFKSGTREDGQLTESC